MIIRLPRYARRIATVASIMTPNTHERKTHKRNKMGIFCHSIAALLALASAAVALRNTKRGIQYVEVKRCGEVVRRTYFHRSVRSQCSNPFSTQRLPRDRWSRPLVDAVSERAHRRIVCRRILVDPTSNIRLSQRLSHACLSTNRFNVKPHKAQYNSYNLQDHLTSYLDNCGKSRANTCKMQEPRGTCAIISQTNRPP